MEKRDTDFLVFRFKQASLICVQHRMISTGLVCRAIVILRFFPRQVPAKVSFVTVSARISPDPKAIVCSLTARELDCSSSFLEDERTDRLVSR
jgi:hypothetical protein